ncbi:uncharacterized protein EI90DRAFT_3115930 [Cantharellus anzutake]|uniref:uncharacterized protein n=1 Tax=Cantharellus anzutake TaxID=1750568 RepID=UPI00190658CD|nr:uncharacterized protein EI90DRAFT_3115930 [Cantharellus anzutake]KAF8342077.1 hypothetical protein EI90DRAFT_3115930 [Cantharellus anzutake]
MTVNQEALIHHVHDRISTLLGALKGMAAEIQITYDEARVCEEKAVDTARVMEVMFRATHENLISDDDYYLVVSECVHTMKNRFLERGIQGKMVKEQEKIRAELKERVAAQGALVHEEVEESELMDLVSEEASTSKAPVLKKKKLVLKNQEAKKLPTLRKRKRAKA